MFGNRKDEYKEATEYASINIHHRLIQNGEGYKIGIFNLFLLTTIGVMGYVGFDSFNKESSFFKNIFTKENQTIKTDKELLDVLEPIDINSIYLEDERESISLAINSVVNNSYLKEDSLYTQSLALEIHKEQK
jgi:hypothetical protein